MKNFIEHGEVMEIAAPTGGVVSGALVVKGVAFGIAATTAAEGAPVNLKLGGVYSLPAASGAWTQGDAVYWDAAASAVTKTTTNNTKIGVAFADKGSSETTGLVRLNGSF